MCISCSIISTLFLRPAVLPDLNRGDGAYELASAQQNAHRLWINIDFSSFWQLEYPLKRGCRSYADGLMPIKRRCQKIYFPARTETTSSQSEMYLCISVCHLDLLFGEKIVSMGHVLPDTVTHQQQWQFQFWRLVSVGRLLSHRKHVEIGNISFHIWDI